MTESEWSASTDPRTMLDWLIRAAAPHESRWGPRHPLATDRKLRLFACACCRLVDRGNHDWIDRWEETSDHYELTDVAWALRWVEVSPGDLPPATQADLLRDLFGNPWVIVERLHHPRNAAVDKCWSRARNPGPGERLMLLDDAWLTWQGGLIPRLAEEAYRGNPCPVSYSHQPHDYCDGGPSTERTSDGLLDPGQLAVLADALEEAGCGDVPCPACEDESGYRVYCDYCKGSGRMGRVPSPLLVHLRSPGPHVRGCWAIDVLTGRQ